MLHLRVGGDHRRSGGDRHSLLAQVSAISWRDVPQVVAWVLYHGGLLVVLLVGGLVALLLSAVVWPAGKLYRLFA